MCLCIYIHNTHKHTAEQGGLFSQTKSRILVTNAPLRQSYSRFLSLFWVFSSICFFFFILLSIAAEFYTAGQRPMTVYIYRGSAAARTVDRDYNEKRWLFDRCGNGTYNCYFDDKKCASVELSLQGTTTNTWLYVSTRKQQPLCDGRARFLTTFLHFSGSSSPTLSLILCSRVRSYLRIYSLPRMRWHVYPWARARVIGTWNMVMCRASIARYVNKLDLSFVAAGTSMGTYICIYICIQTQVRKRVYRKPRWRGREKSASASVEIWV